MSLQRTDFAAFFAELHDQMPPFAWQERLLDELLEHGCWPGRIVAPTGAGKTAVIDVHVFAVALTALGQGPRLPRRLAMVVGRRVLVDDQYQHAEHVRAKVTRPGSEVMAEVARRLRLLHRPPDINPTTADRSGADSVADGAPLVVSRLRGGAAPSREWRDHPSACTVVCATPDMWGSRLLFRGYGTSRLARPREAGLLAIDAAVVVDEAHLSRQLLTTAARVSRLAAAAQEPLPLPALQTVETTATPTVGDRPQEVYEVGVSEADLSASPVLRARLCNPKPVTLIPMDEWPANTVARRRKVAARLADEVTTLLDSSMLAQQSDPPAGHTVGCYVNTVPMAVEVTQALRSRKRDDGTPLRVVTVCGQTRPADLDRLRKEHPGVLTPGGNPDVDVLVTTQSLEVGVDLDFAAVVTELPAASALVQRAGRVNRRGLRPAGPVRIVGPQTPLTERHRSGPYEQAELTAAWQWLTRRAGDEAGLAPWALRAEPAPPAAHRRMLWQRLELSDAWQLARTTDLLAAEPQLDLWLAESFDQENTVGLAVRDAMPVDATDAVALIRLLPPRPHEVFATTPDVARAVVTQATRMRQTSGDTDADTGPPTVVLVRGDEVTAVEPAAHSDAVEVRPGDLIVIDSATAAFTASGANGGFSPPVPVKPGQDTEDGELAATTAADVFHHTAPAVGRVALRLEPGAWAGTWVAPLLKEYADLDLDATDTARRKGLRDLLVATLNTDLPTTADPMLAAAIKLLSRRTKDSELVLHRDADDAPIRLVLLDRRRAWADERLRQRWIPQTQVSLAAHQHAVAARAEWVARTLGLPDEVVAALRLAGLHHDDGKADPRFQAALGADEGTPLAKSGGAPLAEFRRRAEQADLPKQWRHEQRSVVACWAQLHNHLPELFAQLAARLVGTSHGHGRTGFPHTAAELVGPRDTPADNNLAIDLFDHGDWDNLIDNTHHRWGVWGCAYLEAVLRAADGQVSAEGT